MNFLLSAILFALSAIIIIAMIQLMNTIASVRTVRQPVRINQRKEFAKYR